VTVPSSSANASNGTYRLVWTCDQAVLVSERDRLAALGGNAPAGDDGAYHGAEQVEALAMLVTSAGTAPLG